MISAHGDFARQAEDVEEAEAAEPVAVGAHLRLVDVDDLAHLLQVIAGVALDLFLRQPGARLVTAAGIADERGVIADNQDRLMAEFLEKLELPQGHGMSEMHVDAGRIDAVLHAQRLAGGDAALQLLAQIGEWLDLLGSPANELDLFINGLQLHAPDFCFAFLGARSASKGTR